jgi:hypothetical protein
MGKGVLKFELVELNEVPEFVTKDQLTEVVEEILLPVEIKVNNTEEPAQTFKVVPVCKGFVEKLALNCPSTLLESKRSKRMKENLKDVMVFFKL